MRYPRGTSRHNSFVTGDPARCSLSSLCESASPVRRGHFCQQTYQASNNAGANVDARARNPNLPQTRRRLALRRVTHSQNNRASFSPASLQRYSRSWFRMPIIDTNRRRVSAVPDAVERVFLRLCLWYLMHRLDVLPRTHKNSRGAMMEIEGSDRRDSNFYRLMMTRRSGDYRGCCI
jgi:hypothetical protein